MLRNVVENYLDCITEREFDAPFLAILHEEGFFDIHFLHGQYEFGKDFIAKKISGDLTIQYAFQTKAGDMGTKDFRELQMQMEDIRTNPCAHPGFDVALSRQAIAVVTGRLIGGAPIAAQAYKQYCCQQFQSFSFDVWDKGNLLPKLSHGMPLLSAGSAYSIDFVSFYGTVQTNQMEYGQLEKYCRKWQDTIITAPAMEKTAWGILLEGAIISSALFQRKRLWLACMTDLFALRALLTEVYFVKKQPWMEPCIESIYRSFSVHAEPLIAFIQSNSGPDQLCEQLRGAVFITYPVFCLQTVEIVGLLGLLKLKNGDKKSVGELGTLLAAFITRQPGCHHPVSDNYAASLVAPALLLCVTGYSTECETYLRHVVKWVCDRYEDSEFGLAAPGSSARKELDTLAGYAFEFIDLSARRESYLATVLLDLLTILGKDELYELAVNEIKAVGICPSAIIIEESVERFRHNGKNLYAPNISYSDECASKKKSVVAPHHKSEITAMIKQGLWWESIAVCSTLRDRHLPIEIQHALQEAQNMALDSEGKPTG